jgi:hypothetical protein
MDVNKRKVNYLMKMKKISKDDEEPEPAEERDVQDEDILKPNKLYKKSNVKIDSIIFIPLCCFWFWQINPGLKY